MTAVDDPHRTALERTRHHLRAALAEVEAELCMRWPGSLDGDRFLSIQDAATVFGRTELTIRRWARDLGFGRKDGRGRWRLSEQALHAYVQGRAKRSIVRV